MATSFINTKALAKRIAEVKKELEHLLHLETFIGSSTKRGRPARAGKKTSAKRTGRKAKRGAVGEAILKYLSTKGPKGAHVKDIAAAIGNKPANVTAYFYSGAGKKLAKALGGATFALKK